MDAKQRITEKEVLFMYRYGTGQLPRGLVEQLNMDEFFANLMRQYNDIILSYGRMLYDLDKQRRVLTQCIKVPWMDEEFKIECRLARRDVRSQIIEIRGHVQGVQQNMQEIRYRYRFYDPC